MNTYINRKLTLLMLSALVMAMGFVISSYAQTAPQNLALNAKQQSIVAIAAFTARGDLDQLKVALTDGVDAGLSINEIKEVLIQMYAYAGFPRSLNGINTFEVVLNDRQKQGMHDPVGEAPKPVRTHKSKYEIGKDNLTQLTGVQPATTPSGYAAFVPTIEVFLKEHLFADIFERGVLDDQTRELATIAALASIGGVSSQLRSHLNVGMHNGLNEAQLRSLIAVINTQVSKKEAKEAATVLKQVLNQRQ